MFLATLKREIVLGDKKEAPEMLEGEVRDDFDSERGNLT